MNFRETPLAGAYVIDLDLREDNRGFFARSYCRDEFEAHGLDPCCEQCNVSYNRRRGTLRGMHYQRHPYGEAKLVRCTAGSIHDVVVDLRPDSATFTKSFAVELSSRNRRMLYIPEGFAHGFLTLDDDTEVFYQMSRAYVEGAEAGIRYDDPALAIDWPEPVAVISQRDLEYPPFDARSNG